VKVIYNLQDSITVLADGKIRLQPRNTTGARVTTTDELADHPQVVAFSVNRRINIMTLEESAAYEAQQTKAEVAAPPPVKPAPIVELPALPVVNHATPLAAPTPLPELPAVPATSAAEVLTEVSAEGDSADTTEKDSAENFRKRSRRR